jgi:hypothetical protein
MVVTMIVIMSIPVMLMIVLLLRFCAAAVAI